MIWRRHSHPALATAHFRSRGAMSEIGRIARESGVDPLVDLGSLVLTINGSQQAELLRTIVSNESSIAGRRKEVQAIENELVRLEAEIARMSADATRLENLKKDHLVAEAVYTSAVARLDTNKSDLFASYPIAQVMSEPDMPSERSQPQLAVAVAAGVFGTVLVLFAWGAAWANRNFGLGRQRRRSSTGRSLERGDSGSQVASIW